MARRSFETTRAMTASVELGAKTPKDGLMAPQPLAVQEMHSWANGSAARLRGEGHSGETMFRTSRSHTVQWLPTWAPSRVGFVSMPQSSMHILVETATHPVTTRGVSRWK